MSRIREFISTPFIQLSLPTVVADDANKPAQFQAEFIELTPQKKLVELELTINANGLDTTKKMKQIKGKYLIEMPPVPESKEGPKYSVRLMLQDGSITGLCPEHTFSIGKQKLQLKDVLSLQFEPTQTRAMLIDGNALTGPLSGLKHWTIPLGGVDRKIPLTKIKQVIIAPSQLARVVQCTVQAKRDGKVIAETRQTLLIGRPEELP